LQRFLEKDNFIIKSTNAKRNVRLCLVGIQKQNASSKMSAKIKGLPCLHWHIQFPWGKIWIDTCLVPSLLALS
jgi:hypothetical protein